MFAGLPPSFQHLELTLAAKFQLRSPPPIHINTQPVEQKPFPSKEVAFHQQNNCCWVGYKELNCFCTKSFPRHLPGVFERKIILYQIAYCTLLTVQFWYGDCSAKRKHNTLLQNKPGTKKMYTDLVCRLRMMAQLGVGYLKYKK